MTQSIARTDRGKPMVGQAKYLRAVKIAATTIEETVTATAINLSSLIEA